MLHSSNQAGQNSSDPYKTAAIDTIVAEVQSTLGEDRCVLLLGYRDKLEEMFKYSNPGLARRFPLDDGFVFEDFNDEELRQILDLKLKQQDLQATEEAKTVALDVLSKARRRMNFGNGGEVENLISHAKQHYGSRMKSVPVSARPTDIVFEPEDFDEDYNRSQNATVNCRELFKDIIGCEEVVSKLEGYTRTFINMRDRGLDPSSVIPFNFIFKGPPGTGKTTTARKMGQVFYEMGFLSSSDVHECSASDLIGQYVGHTGPKTTAQLEKALGSVLFIDEAYRLGEGNFATEAGNELVDNLTKPKFMGKIIVILAGYEDAMNQLLSVNQGLSSRFPEEVNFKNMSPQHCLDLLCRSLEKSNVEVSTTDQASVEPQILNTFDRLSELRSWGNGRDVNTIAKSITARIFRDSDTSASGFRVTLSELRRDLEAAFQEKSARELATRSSSTTLDQQYMPQLSKDPLGLRPPRTSSGIAKAKSDPSPASQDSESEPQSEAPDYRESTVQRDDGVPDEVWNQLQIDKAAEVQKQKDEAAQLARLDEESKMAAKEESDRALEQERAKVMASQAADQQNQKMIDEAKRRHEVARLEYLKALRAKQEAEERQKQAAEEMARKRKEETQVRQKLRGMGVCSAGYGWTKQPGGYRCAGGVCFVSNAQFGLRVCN